jgi:hypothetical protein
MKIKKQFVKTPEADIRMTGAGMCSEVSWERLKDHIGSAVALRSNEIIVGLIADENGVKVMIERNK